MGHFRQGFSPQVVGNYVREERYSVEDFNFALQYFISPSIGRFALGEPCSVVVMDNCRIHDSDELSTLYVRKEELLYSCRMYGV